MVPVRGGGCSQGFKSLIAERAAREGEGEVKRRIQALADPNIIPVLSVSLGDVQAGPTAEGGFAVKTGRQSEAGGLKAGVELRPGEPPRWGVMWELRF